MARLSFRSQRGIGGFGTLVILVIAAVAGYYAYKNFLVAPEQPPSCRARLNSCIANCRKTTSEAGESQACQARCSSDAQACEQPR
jgi:hypothetical protein